ncbi:MAG: glutathione S-transferase family protein, partial [Rhizobiaceae bacterium]
MPEIEPTDRSLKSLNGLHLWHAPLSSCSQRVRIVLSETGKDYQSHLVNLEKDEHASEAYQAIHSKGLVPALVDDGRLFIESIDIIQHVGGDAPGFGENQAPDLLRRADEAQADLKLLTFEFLFRSSPPPSPEKAEAFQSSHNNEWLRKFRQDFAKGFDRERLDDAVQRTDEAFKHLDEILSDGRDYLAGNYFSLADVAWMPNVHRFALMNWPYERTPHLANWFERVSKRP